jgi:hypothetical protein
MEPPKMNNVVLAPDVQPTLLSPEGIVLERKTDLGVSYYFLHASVYNEIF